MIIFLFFAIAIFFIMSVPITFAVGTGTLLSVILSGDLPLTLLPQRIFYALDNWVLMAIPLFMLAGNLMKEGGLSKRIVLFCDELFGFIKGGLAIVSVAASMVFAGVSGSSTADTAAIGSIMLPAMKEDGYNMKFATALQAAAGSIGPVIPPSILMIIIGFMTNTSVAKLFLGGIIPGVLVGIGLMIISYLHAMRGGEKYLPVNKKFSLKKVLKTGWNALPGIGLPFIIIFGIIGGVFTATEAAVVAVVYGLIIGFFVYKELTVKKIPKILLNSAELACIVMLVCGSAYFFTWFASAKHIPDIIANFMMENISSKFGYLILLNVILLIVGMFMESFSAIVILMPILFPVAQIYGINPIHFGVIVCVNLAIGYITPPYGATLFVSCSLTGKSIREITPYIIPIFLVMIIVLMIITYLPQSFMWIPNMVNK